MRGREQKWEDVRDDTEIAGLGAVKITSQRLRVHGGYIYRTVTWSAHNNGVAMSVAQTFVSGPHE